MEVINAIRDRRTIRKFRDKEEVTRETLRSIIDAARWAPCACNKQRWEFVIVDDDKVKKELIQKANFSFLKKIPVVVYVLYDSKINPENYAHIQSAAASIQNMLLSAHSKGIGSWWIAAYGDKKRTREVLDIPNNMLIISAIAFGYPDSTSLTPPRRPLEEIIHFNKFDGEAISQRKIWTIKNVIDFCKLTIHATSPEIGYRPYFIHEFQKEIEFICQEIKEYEDIVVFYDFSGTHLFELAKRNHNKKFISYIPNKEIRSWQNNRAKTLKIENITFTDKLENDSIEVILCFELLNKISNKSEVIEEMRQSLNVNGKLLMTIINKHSFHGLYAPRSLRLLGPEIPVSISQIKKLLNSNGFKVENTSGIDLFPSSYITKSESGFTGEAKLRKFAFLINIISFDGATERYWTQSIIKNICRLNLLKCQKELPVSN